MGEHMRISHHCSDFSLDGFAVVVPFFDAPASRHEHVQGDEAPGAGHARAQGMEVNAIAAALFEVGLEALQFRLRQRMVHQARGCFSKQIQPGEADVDGHGNGNQGIKHQPTRELDQHDGHHDADGGPDIAEQVLGVSPQRD